MTQPEFGKFVGIAPSTVAKIESLHLPFSLYMAEKISASCGVSLNWLLDGDPQTVPPATMISGKTSREFTLQSFESHRVDRVPLSAAGKEVHKSIRRIKEIARLAGKARKTGVFAYRLSRIIVELDKEFGSKLGR